MHYAKPQEASRTIGVDVATLRAWEREGKIKAIRTPKGMRMYDITSYQQTSTATETNRVDICYARVSSARQRDDLDRQIDFLRRFHPDTQIISDIGSGVNFTRLGFARFLDEVAENRVRNVFVIYRDRFARIGIDLIIQLFTRNATKLVVHNEHDETPVQELTEDLVAIVTSFAGRMHGLRRYARQLERDQRLDQDEDETVPAVPEAGSNPSA
jgi:predicted site-specific integrase-resolvase